MTKEGTGKISVLIRRSKRVFLVKERQITEAPQREPAAVETLRART